MTNLNHSLSIDKYLSKASFTHVGPYFYYVFNDETNQVEFIDHHVQQVLGYHEQVFTVNHFLDNIHPKDLPFFLNFKHTAATFLKKLPAEKISKYKISYDFRVRQSDGEYVRMLKQGLVIQHDERGTVTRTLEFYTAITHIKPQGNPILNFIGLDGEPSYYSVSHQSPSQEQQPKFTIREREVLKYLVEGWSSKMIAEKLFISTFTVAVHRKNIAKKADAKSAGHLIREAIQNKWV